MPLTTKTCISLLLKWLVLKPRQPITPLIDFNKRFCPSASLGFWCIIRHQTVLWMYYHETQMQKSFLSLPAVWSWSRIVSLCLWCFCRRHWMGWESFLLLMHRQEQKQACKQASMQASRKFASKPQTRCRPALYLLKRQRYGQQSSWSSSYFALVFFVRSISEPWPAIDYNDKSSFNAKLVTSNDWTF